MLTILKLRLIFLLLILGSLHLGSVELGKVALVVIETLRMLVNNIGGSGIEERSVMGTERDYLALIWQPSLVNSHDQECTGPSLEVVFQPGNSVEIQHVRRLIKH